MGLDFKIPCKFTLSANEIRVFSECARKRYYSSRDCLAIRANTPRKALILGTAFHSALQYYYENIDAKLAEIYGGMEYTFTYDDVLDVYEQIAPYSFFDENGELTVSEADYKTLTNMINCYIPQLLNDLVEYEVIGCEVTFNLENWPIYDVMYHGLIDMIVRKRLDDKIYFFEHKTCANFRPEIYSRFDIQLHIYSIEGHQKYGDQFGGIILNQVKKAKTEKGYDQQRDLYNWDDKELGDFELWLTKKTIALVSPDNCHAPCNNYMSCKMCEYIDICMRYGYEVPKSHVEITGNPQFSDDEGNPLYAYDPRDSKDEGGEE